MAQVVYRIDPSGKVDRIRSASDALSADIILVAHENRVDIYCRGQNQWELTFSFIHVTDLETVSEVLSHRYNPHQILTVGTFLFGWFETSRQKEYITEPIPYNPYRGLPPPMPSTLDTSQRLEWVKWLVRTGRIGEGERNGPAGFCPAQDQLTDQTCSPF